jgi:pimeloyl-ACP methyl ester carboxylesterase
VTDVYLARGDVVLRGTATGSGPTVLLLHAGGEDRRVWIPIADHLAERKMRAVAFDLRSHGDSGGTATTLRTVADDVVAMIDHVSTPVVVVGASLGGLAAIAALADPVTAGQVAGLALVDVAPDPDPGRTRAWLHDRGLERARRELVDDILSRGRERLAIAAALDLPVLLIRAAQGPIADADVARLVHANRRVEVTCVAGVGHLIARDAPTELARILAGAASPWLRDSSSRLDPEGP